MRLTAPLAAALGLLAVLPVFGSEPAAKLTHNGAIGAVRVEASLVVGGEMLRGDPATPERLPISAEAVTAYRQATRAEPAAAARRWYESGTLTVRGEKRASLADPQETFVAELRDGALSVGSTTRSLTRNEIHLAELPADPLTLGGLLPTKAVQVSDEWTLGAEALGPLLGLDSVTLCDATAVLTDLTVSHARLRLAGVVHGASAGATTEISLSGVALVDRRAGLVTQCNLGLEERREIGPATPGLDTTAKVSVRCAVKDGGLADGAPAAEPLPDQGLTVSYLTRFEGPRGEWSCEAPRGWRMLSRTSATLSLGLVEDNRLAAELLLRTLPGRRPSLEQFSTEARSAIEAASGAVAGVYEGATPTGLISYAVHGHGEQSGEPAVWRHYLLAPAEPGPAVSAVATAPTPTRTDDGATPEQAVLDRLVIRPWSKIAATPTNNRRE